MLFNFKRAKNVQSSADEILILQSHFPPRVRLIAGEQVLPLWVVILDLYTYEVFHDTRFYFIGHYFRFNTTAASLGYFK